MTTDKMRDERITWLRVEFAEAIERCERSAMTRRELGDFSTLHTSQSEIEMLGDELLRYAFWAMQHFCHQPACWAPSTEEMDYLKRCLRDEDLFDPDQIEFTVQSRHGG